MTVLDLASEELNVLAQLTGRPGFPGVRASELDVAGRDAIVRGLVAAGVLGPGGAGEETTWLLGSVVAAQDALSVSVFDDARGDRLATVWRCADDLVLQERLAGGRNRLRPAGRAEVAALVAEVLDGLPEGTPEAAAGAPVALAPEQLVAVLERHEAGEPASRPELAAWLAAMDDGVLAWFELGHPDDSPREALRFAGGRDGTLWLEHMQSFPVPVHRLAPVGRAEAGERVERLLAEWIA